MEAAAKKTREMKVLDKSGQATGTVHKLSKHNKQGSASSVPSIPKLCPRCGRGKHSRDQWKFKHATCNTCGNVGHISPVCWSKKAVSSKQSSHSTKLVTTETDSHSAELLFTISDHSSIPPYQVELKINNKPLAMEIDTGSGISLISESVLHALLPQLKLQESAVTLRTHTGEVIKALL